jgi:hypothetical protein
VEGERKRTVENVGEGTEGSRRRGQIEEKKGGDCLFCVRFGRK